MNGDNFPTPSGVADQIIAKAIECLDRDIWHKLTDKSITIRSVMFWLNDVTIHIEAGEVSTLKWGVPSEAYKDAFRESYKAAMERKRERLMQPKLASISDENFGRSSMRWRIGASIAGVVAGGFLVFAVVGGITSCSEQVARAEAADKARDSEVNKYGFKRGGIADRKVWPDDCKSSGWIYLDQPDEHHNFTSVYDCKSHWEDWERGGRLWVDWKAAP